ncbi:hypothetical protein [Paraburkholderia sp. 32]|uniref:hypothetical protein n=1 Tax=Paraburkholderia sp. 32 TaxID=2991057 RepID=UPI003D249202
MQYSSTHALHRSEQTRVDEMTKAQALANIADLYRVFLYRVFNMAGSDNPNRADWTTPAMAGRAGCQHLDRLLRSLLTADEREALYANL